MHIISFIIDFILHINDHLVSVVHLFGDWTYLILFAVIFIETGAVIMPFLPGDSLLFAACALAANPEYHLNFWLFAFLFFVACLSGDSLNFFIGSKVGRSVSQSPFWGRFIKEENLRKTEAFFEKHGGVAISLARFIPIIRTMSPFVSGASGVTYKTFLKYNVIGAVSWVVLCCCSGYFFGNFPVVKKHFSLIIIGIIIVSLLPAIFTALKAKLKQSN